MFFRTSEPIPSIGIGSSISVSILGISGGSVPLRLSAPTEIPIRREEPSMRMDAGEQLPRAVSRLIKDAVSNGRPLHEIEDYLDWLENTCPSRRI